MRPRINAALLVLFTLASSNALAAPSDLKVRVIRASNTGKGVDAKLADLAKELAALKFDTLELADEASFKLEVGAQGRMQMPGKEWMTVKSESVAPDGKLRLAIAVEKLEFKAVVAVDAGATVAVRGPDFQGAPLILVVTRAGAAK
jgi:hypothetical protein